jgi:hypothetical protein
MWDVKVLHDIMTICIILHNLIIERKRQGSNEDVEERVTPVDFLPPVPVTEQDRTYGAFLSKTLKIVDRVTHHQLREDLMNHIWNRSRDRVE